MSLISVVVDPPYQDNAPKFIMIMLQKSGKKKFKYLDTEHSMGDSFYYSWDITKLQYLADHCDDEDILRAVFESAKVKDGPSIKRFICNVNLPDDIIIKLCKASFV